jgi:uncharacterized protein YjiS (DUF1127 family)
MKSPTTLLGSARVEVYGIGEPSELRYRSRRGPWNAFALWRRRRRERAELYALSDFALGDFGVYRADIDSIVNSQDRDASGRVR